MTDGVGVLEHAAPDWMIETWLAGRESIATLCVSLGELSIITQEEMLSEELGLGTLCGVVLHSSAAAALGVRQLSFEPGGVVQYKCAVSLLQVCSCIGFLSFCQVPINEPQGELVERFTAGFR